DLVRLGRDHQHRVDETVDLLQVLRFGGFDHQRAGHREGHGGGVEAVVDQALDDVVDGDAGAGGHRSQVHDALVGDQALVPGVEDLVGLGETAGHVVGG